MKTLKYLNAVCIVFVVTLIHADIVSAQFTGSGLDDQDFMVGRHDDVRVGDHSGARSVMVFYALNRHRVLQ